MNPLPLFAGLFSVERRRTVDTAGRASSLLRGKQAGGRCGCFGNLIPQTGTLRISPQVADKIKKVVLAYLLIGSYGLLIWEWRAKKLRVDAGELRGSEQVPAAGG